ncbi:MAG TPA: hypothetical protein VKE74_03685, partial [Gemmataceae bacterium]|nr:hypothetical protein [Gemmataceae bacterium]
MTTPRQIEANRLNALKSTGPKTALGKAKAARNALRHGLFALPAVIPELGESVDDWLTFAARVVRSFDPDGVTQRQLAYRAAQLMWRLDRVGRSDAAVIAAVVAAALPPDPATVAPEKSSHPFHPPGPLPPDAPAQQKLARHRAGLRSARNNLEDIRATAGRVRALPGLPDAENVGGYSLALVGAVERATGLDPEVARSGLVVIRQGLGLKDATFLPAGWTAAVTRMVFRILANGLGVRPGEFAGRVAAELD